MFLPFVHLSYFPTSTSVLNCWLSHIWEQLYINLRKTTGTALQWYMIACNHSKSHPRSRSQKNFLLGLYAKSNRENLLIFLYLSADNSDRFSSRTCKIVCWINCPDATKRKTSCNSHCYYKNGYHWASSKRKKIIIFKISEEFSSEIVH